MASILFSTRKTVTRDDTLMPGLKDFAVETLPSYFAIQLMKMFIIKNIRTSIFWNVETCHEKND